jgi:hypothetical protein
MCDTDRVHSSPDPDKSSVNAHRGDMLEFAATLQRAMLSAPRLATIRAAIGDGVHCDRR